MNATQISHGLASLDPNHEFFQAVLALVDADIDDETNSATAPDLADGARHFNAGRLAHARDVKNVLIGAVRDAHAKRAAESTKQQQREK